MASSSANSFCSQFTGECEDYLSAEASGEQTVSPRLKQDMKVPKYQTPHPVKF